MGRNPRFSALARPDSIVAASNGGTLSIYDGAQPAGPATAVTSQRTLARLTLTPFTAPVITAGEYSAQASQIAPVQALQTGNATWFRVWAADGTPVFDGEVGTSDSDLVLAPATLIAAGVTVSISNFNVGGKASQDISGVGAVTVPPPSPPAPVVPSGFTGREPAFPGAISWCGYSWEVEGWGTSAGWPAASQVSIDANGYLNLKVSMADGNLLGAEVDSVRGDLGIAGNPSRWGYGTYRWVIGTDLATIDPTLVLGMFTFWAYGSPASVPPNANGKGGPAGQKEIDMEVSNWLPEANRETGTFYMLGYYQDNSAGVTAGVPATYGQQCHTMTEGSQSLVPGGHPVSTMEFEWMPDHITWRIWYSADTSGPPDYTLTMTEGQVYNYTEPYGGNVFAGTVHIPATGGQQVIMNLWAQGRNVAVPDTVVVLRSFSYTPNGA